MKLDRKITFYQPVQIKSASGMETTTYELISSSPSVFAEVRWLNGAEKAEGKQRVASLTCSFGIRYRTDLRETMIIKLENQYFDISKILQLDRRQWMLIEAEAKDNDWTIPL